MRRQVNSRLENIKHRITLCLKVNGQHFQQLYLIIVGYRTKCQSHVSFSVKVHLLFLIGCTNNLRTDMRLEIGPKR